MKTKLVTNLKKTLGILCVFACAGLSLLFLAYINRDRNLDAVEQEARLTEAMVQAARYHVLLTQINGGDLAQVRRYLSSGLDFDVNYVKTMAAECTQPRTKAFAVEFTDRMRVAHAGKTDWPQPSIGALPPRA